MLRHSREWGAGLSNKYSEKHRDFSLRDEESGRSA